MMTLEDHARLEWPSRFHAVQFYANDDFLIHSVSSFVTDGLTKNGIVIVIATEAHCAALKESLRHFDHGKLMFVHAENLLSQIMRDGRPDKKRFLEGFGEIHQQVTPGSRVFVFGETAAMLCAQGLHRAAIMLEQLGGELSAKFRLSMLCGYPHSVLEGSQMDFMSEIHPAHTHLRVGGSMIPLS